MTETIKLYQYDYAAYFTGNTREISIYDGYDPSYWTDQPVPEVPEGHFAKFEKHIHQWVITNKYPPEFFDSIAEEQVGNESQFEPVVI